MKAGTGRANPLRFNGPDRLAFDQILGCGLNACAEEDLTSFGLVLETRGKICDRPDCGVFEQSLPTRWFQESRSRERLRCRS